MFARPRADAVSRGTPRAALTRCAALLGLLALPTGCVSEAVANRELMDELAHPPPDVVATVARLQPAVAAWYRDAESIGLARGRPLDADELRLARAIGVAEPERVRLVLGIDYPPPADTGLPGEAQRIYGTPSAPPPASTFGHTVWINPQFIRKRWLIAHELTHVKQFERLGMDGFVHDYLLQLTLLGRAYAPMEREARANEHLAE